MLRLSKGSSSDFFDEAGFYAAGTEHHSSKVVEFTQKTSIIYLGALKTPSILLAVERLLVNLEIVPPPSLVNQIAFLVKEHAFTFQQP